MCLCSGNICISISNVQIRSHPSFISILIILNLLEMILQHHRSMKSISYLLHFDVIVSKDLLSTEHFGPGERKKDRRRFSLSFCVCTLKSSVLPSTGHYFPCGTSEREKMDACLSTFYGHISSSVEECLF